MADTLTLLAEALDHEDFSHCTTRPWCGKNVLYVYHRNAKSPSGVLLAHGADADDPEVQAVLKERGERVHAGPTRGDMTSGPY